MRLKPGQGRGVYMADATGAAQFWVGFDGLDDAEQRLFARGPLVVRQLPDYSLVGAVVDLSDDDFAELYALVTRSGLLTEDLLTEFVQEQDRRIGALP